MGLIPSSGVPVFAEKFVDKMAMAFDYSEGYMDGQSLDAKGNSGLFVNERWAAGPCLFTQRTMDASVFRHETKHFGVSGAVINAYRLVEGHLSGVSEGTPHVHAAKTVAILDYARPFVGVQSPNICQTVYIPHAAIGFDSGRHPSLVSFTNSTTMGQVLNAELDACFDHLLAGNRKIPERTLARFMSCLQVAFSNGRTHSYIRTDAREALGDVIKKHIEANLLSEDLSAASILQSFGVSRATLYRIFEPYGGVRSYISERRLVNAVQEIASKPLLRGRISTVAEEWGYTSYVAFNRAVRGLFGVSPSSLFQHPIGDDRSASHKSSLADYVRIPGKKGWSDTALAHA